MTLRIGIDATAWSNQRGDGRFLRNAARRLVGLYPDVDWVLFTDEAGAEEVEGPPRELVHSVRLRGRPTEALETGSVRSPADLARLTLAVQRAGLDAFLSPSVYNYFPVLGVPSVVGLHDATATTHARLVLPSWRDRALWRVKQRLALRLANRLFTVSAASRAAIAAALGLPLAGIEVVPEAADPVFAPPPAAAVDAVLDELGLSREPGYLLFAAGLSRHKGLDDLIEAYAAATRGPGPAPALVVAGSQEGPYPSAAREAKERIGALGIEDRVRFPGFVSDSTLASLYSAATAVIVPSHSEGFGLSALEAAACGAPVILSDLGAHRETLDGAARFFPPGDRAALADRLRELLTDVERTRELRERATAAAARYSWDETARRLFALLADAAASGRRHGDPAA